VLGILKARHQMDSAIKADASSKQLNSELTKRGIKGDA